MNILDQLLNDILEIKTMLASRPDLTIQPPEIIDSEQLCQRLGISEPTLIKWRAKRRIPFIKIEGVIRYNWPSVIASLESQNKK